MDTNRHRHRLFLVTGDPFDPQQPEGFAGASSTRFVFPFAFSPVRTTQREKAPHYLRLETDATAEWISRQRYLTEETGRVLFARASWFELAECEKAAACCAETKWDLQLVTGKFIVHLRPPKLILFEWSPNESKEAEKPRQDPERNDLFHTGFLLIDAFFPTEGSRPTFQDFLQFNETFRYWRRPWRTHEDERLWPMLAPHYNGRYNGRERRSESLYLERWLHWLRYPLSDGEDWWDLCPSKWLERTRQWWSREIKDGLRPVSEPHCAVYMDNRALVWTCAVVCGGINTVQIDVGCPAGVPAEETGPWVKLLNVDAPGSLQDASDYERAWAKEHSYTRWKHFGTLYGFTYHSGALIGGLCADPPYWRHFHEHYFDMALLLLYLRVSIFRFSGDLGKLSETVRDGGQDLDEIRQKFEGLRSDFALLTNLYQFPLISNQQQAVEMYKLMREHLNVGELFQEVQQEIQSTHDFFELRAGTRIQQRADRLAQLGLPLAAAAVMLGVFALSGDEGRAGAWVLEWHSNLLNIRNWSSDLPIALTRVDQLLVVICLAVLGPLIRVVRWFLNKRKRH